MNHDSPLNYHLAPRADRVPLYVQVVTQPALTDCWSVNISSSGVGLVAAQPKVGFEEGSELELELVLPDSRTKLLVRGLIRWRHDGEAQDGPLSLGVEFLHMAVAARVQLLRYLGTHTFRVAVAFADEAERRLMHEVLGPHAELFFADIKSELAELVRRGDLAAVLVMGPGDEAVELVRALFSHEDMTGVALRDLAPRVVFGARAPSDTIVELFNQGSIHRAMSRPLVADELLHAVLSACREHGVRTEQRRVGLALERALLRERMQQKRSVKQVTKTPRLIYESQVMQGVMELLQVVAPHKLAVLLQGETGTGKEVLAHTLHELSFRKHAPIVVQDCGVLSETLLESELFGHVKGAFTGAIADHPGLFVMADGGTVFLDEIENTTPNLQARLLRVLETGEVRPVGGTTVRQVDVRIIAASNRDLADEVRHGRFRSDLYYRLNSFPIVVPPLAQRQGDVLVLARSFLASLNETLGRTATGIAEDAARALVAYGWPGNVRELRNVMERAVLLSKPGKPITCAELPAAVVDKALHDAMERGDSLRARLARAEEQIIAAALERHDGVVRRAAQDLLADPVTLGRKAKKYGLV